MGLDLGFVSLCFGIRVSIWVPKMRWFLVLIWGSEICFGFWFSFGAGILDTFRFALGFGFQLGFFGVPKNALVFCFNLGSEYALVFVVFIWGWDFGYVSL